MKIKKRAALDHRAARFSMQRYFKQAKHHRFKRKYAIIVHILS